MFQFRVVSLDLLREKTPAEWLPGNSASLRRRMNALEEWLTQQPESVIALVGHSQYFKALLNLSYKFRNCDVYKLQFDSSAKLGEAAMPKESPKLIFPWGEITGDRRWKRSRNVSSRELFDCLT